MLLLGPFKNTLAVLADACDYLVLNSDQVSPKQVCLDINEPLIFKSYATGNSVTCIIFHMFRSLPFDTNTQIKEAEREKIISKMITVSSAPNEEFTLC